MIWKESWIEAQGTWFWDEKSYELQLSPFYLLSKCCGVLPRTKKIFTNFKRCGWKTSCSITNITTLVLMWESCQFNLKGLLIKSLYIEKLTFYNFKIWYFFSNQMNYTLILSSYFLEKTVWDKTSTLRFGWSFSDSIRFRNFD